LVKSFWNVIGDRLSHGKSDAQDDHQFAVQSRYDHAKSVPRKYSKIIWNGKTHFSVIYCWFIMNKKRNKNTIWIKGVSLSKTSLTKRTEKNETWNWLKLTEIVFCLNIWLSSLYRNVHVYFICAFDRNILTSYSFNKFHTSFYIKFNFRVAY
jgi:hypothetical protein